MNNADEKEKKLRRKSRRGKIIRTSALTVLSLALGIAIAFQYKSIQENSKASAATQTLSDSQARVIELTDEIKNIEQEKADLEYKISILEEGSNEEQLQKMEEELAKVKAFAGLTRVSGAGLRITVTYEDTNLVPYSGGAMQRLINELKAADAQAISVNGARLTAVSEVCIVNQYLVVNGRQYTQPFEILVTGKPADLISALQVDGVGNSFESLASFSYAKEDKIIIEAYDKDIPSNLLNLAD